MKTLGTILIAIGILMLIWTGFSYTREENVVDLGPLDVNVEKTEQVNWPPYIGLIAIGGGLVLILMDRRR